MPYIKLLSLFLEFGSNSSVVSNSGIVVCDLNWNLYLGVRSIIFLWMLQAALKLYRMDCSYY